ncbi:MAG: hypothetical protein WCK86_24190, partial [Planctomycetia bacterium]
LISMENAAIGKLAPVIQKLQSVASLRIGDDFTTMSGVRTEVTTVGVSDATAFIGSPPSGGFDFTEPLNGQGAIGIYVENFNLALGMFKPTLSQSLPGFTAAKMTIGDAGFTDGGANVLTLALENVDVQVNTGKPLISAGSVLKNATINFPLSFPAATGGQAGYAVATGTYSKPTYLDFTNEVIEASVGNVTIGVSEFIHLTGSVAFKKGGAQTVHVTEGLASSVVSAGLGVLGLTLPPGISIPATGATTTEVEFLTIGAADLTGFVGIGGPYRTNTKYKLRIAEFSGTVSLSYGSLSSSLLVNTEDSDATLRTNLVNSLIALGIAQTDVRVTGGRQFGLTIEFISGSAGLNIAGLQVSAGGAAGVSITKTATGVTNDHAIGLVVDDFDLAMALMTPTNPFETALGVKYYSLKGSVGEIAFVGVPDLTVEAERMSVDFNWSTPVFYGFPLFPVVDYANTPSFASEELALFDQNGNGTLTRGDLATLNQQNGTNLSALNTISSTDSVPADHAWLLEILDVNNDGMIDLVEAQAVFGSTTSAEQTVVTHDIDNDGKIDPLGYE